MTKLDSALPTGTPLCPAGGLSCVQQDSLAEAMTFTEAFRVDLREWRPVIHQPPVMPSALDIELITPSSSATFACKGSSIVVLDPNQNPPETATINWSGSGSIQPADLPLEPSENRFAIQGALTNSNALMNIQLFITEANGLCNANVSGHSISFLDGPPSNFTLNLDPGTAAIQPNTLSTGPNGLCPGPSIFLNGACPTVFSWGTIPPMTGTAPDPNSAR